MSGDRRVWWGVVLVGGIVAFALGRWAGGRPAVVVEPGGVVQEPAPAPVPATAPPRAGPVPAGVDLDAEIAAQRAQNDELDAELHGPPMAWPDEATKQRAEAEYREIVTEVAAECLGGGRITEMLCEEPPCIAVVRGAFTEPMDLESCEPWAERFTATPIHASNDMPIPCGEVRMQRVTVLVPAHEADQRGHGVEGGYELPASYDDEQKRTRYRVQQVMSREMVRCEQ